MDKNTSNQQYDLLIVGSGAAGLSAAIYAGRYKMKTLVLKGEFGGETATAGLIENYPGFKAIDGYDLMKVMQEQAQAIGAEVKDGWAEKLQKDGECFLVTTKKKEQYQAKTVILGIGSQRRKLGLPNEKELTGKGVHYCWTCDGPLYGGKIVGMIGGGDSSVKGVNFLSEYAEKIYLIVQGDEVVAAAAMEPGGSRNKIFKTKEDRTTLSCHGYSTGHVSKSHRCTQFSQNSLVARISFS